jgi:UDP-N-acetylmuramyl pentapeptide phosphotransferase/UDP-N-acetylglucosamine-1-phosphate transferase
MRRMVGLIALALPFALAAGAILAALLISGHLPHPLLQRSISDYYYTPMRDYYVGSLCAIAAFLVCSRGYDLHDEITGYLAGVCALGVACCPSFNPRSSSYTPLEFACGLIHTAFAALMYLIYGVSGLIMVACMVAMVGLTLRSVVERRHPSHWLFWCEALANCVFGVAWLTKGEGFMRDKRHNHNHALAHHHHAAIPS